MSTFNKISSMSDDINMHVLSFATPTDLHNNVGRVSKKFKTLSNDGRIWNKIATQLHVEIEPNQSPKTAVFSNLAELNRIYTTAIRYLRQQQVNHPKLFPDSVPEVPMGRNPLDIYSKILKICADDVRQMQRSGGIPISLSPTRELVDLFRKGDVMVFQQSNLDPVPAEIRDPRLMHIFSAAGVKSILDKKNWKGV